MPLAEHCTGFKMSKPASMKLSRKRTTLPQECLKLFHAVLAWIQAFTRW
jgi:hypothetical protein